MSRGAPASDVPRDRVLEDEARINDGDRLVHRIDGDPLWVVDVVAHDDIGRYGRMVDGLF